MSRFGDQPARKVLLDRELAVTDASLAMDVGYPQLFSALRGHTRPSEVIRERLPKYLGLPLESLFTPEALEPIGTRRGRKDPAHVADAVQKIVDSWPALSEEQVKKLRSLLVPVA